MMWRFTWSLYSSSARKAPHLHLRHTSIERRSNPTRTGDKAVLGWAPEKPRREDEGTGTVEISFPSNNGSKKAQVGPLEEGRRAKRGALATPIGDSIDGRIRGGGESWSTDVGYPTWISVAQGLSVRKQVACFLPWKRCHLASVPTLRTNESTVACRRWRATSNESKAKIKGGWVSRAISLLHATIHSRPALGESRLVEQQHHIQHLR